MSLIFSTIVGVRLPDRDDGREQYQEPEHVDVPQPTESVKRNQRDG